jgi:hypothetical protein
VAPKIYRHAFLLAKSILSQAATLSSQPPVGQDDTEAVTPPGASKEPDLCIPCRTICCGWCATHVALESFTPGFNEWGDIGAVSAAIECEFRQSGSSQRLEETHANVSNRAQRSRLLDGLKKLV